MQTPLGSGLRVRLMRHSFMSEYQKLHVSRYKILRFIFDTCLFLLFRSEQLRRGVYDMGFNKPSKIQETALPMLLADP